MKNKKIIIFLILLVVFLYTYLSKKVDITRYTVKSDKISKKFDDYTIVQLSDFHSKGYNDTTEIIINEIEKINPDIIVMTGDMISWDVENIDELQSLIKSLITNYPIYYINGNHEELAEILKSKEYENFINDIKSLGVSVLKNTYIELIRDGESINLYEIDIPLDEDTGLYVAEEELDDDYINDTLLELDKNKFNMLLEHNPLFIEEYSDWGADLVLSGHMHGGIIRIPIIGIGIGIASPEGNYFPKYDTGEFKVGNTTMIVNRGIGVSSGGLRVFNKPEISVITLKSK